MKFEIELQGSSVAIQEPVPIVFRLTLGEVGMDLPIEYSTVDVVTLVLLDEAGVMLARADGYTKLERMGFPILRVSQGSLQTVRMEAGEVTEWVDDLVAHFDLSAPGNYQVLARFVFVPASVVLDTAPVPLRILPSRCLALDVVQDTICLPMFYFLQQHATEEATRTFLRLTSTAQPLAFWEGASLPIPPGVVPRLSEADFTATESFQHDTVRWIAWLEGDSLKLTSSGDTLGAGQVYDVPLGLEGPALCGRPIQHVDGSVSAVLVGQARPDEVGVYKLDIREDGQEIGRMHLLNVTPGSWPVACAPDIEGGLHMVAATGRDLLPLHLLVRSSAGRITQGELLPGEFFGEGAPGESRSHAARVLAIRLRVKPSPGPNAVLVVALLDREETRRGQGDILQLIQIFLEEAGAETAPVQVRSLTLPRGLLQANETVIGADIARVQATKLHVLFTTSLGRVFHVPPRGEPAIVAEVPVGQGALSTLVVGLTNEVHGFFPTAERGVVSRLLAKAKPKGSRDPHALPP
jgi:hypothetical protein